MAISTTERATNERKASEPAANDSGGGLECSSTQHAKPLPRESPAATAAMPVTTKPAAAPASAESELGAPFAARAASAARRGLRYVGRHPFRSIAVATAAGALIEAELAVALGVVASTTVLLVTPNGAAKRRELERQIDRMGKGAVTLIRETFKSGPGAQPPRE